MKTRTLKLAALAAAIMGLMALPAGASASWMTWADGGGNPLDTYGVESVTANVEGEISFQRGGAPFGVDLTCDATGEIDLWNDGEGYAPGKNEITDLEFSNCVGGTYGACNYGGATASNLPWSGDLSQLQWDGIGSSFSGANISLTYSNCGFASPLTGTLNTELDVDGNGCVESFNPTSTLSHPNGGPVTVSGALEVQSIDGLSEYSPADCAVPY